jgi:Family of unknown function (DUF5706)
MNLDDETSNIVAIDKQFEFAIFQIQNLQEMIQRTDTKAQVILGANTILFSGILALFSDVKYVFVNGTYSSKIFYVILLVSFALAAIVSMIRAFFAVTPRATLSFRSFYQVSEVPMFSFRSIGLSYKEPNEYSQALLKSSPEELLTHAGAYIHGLSKVAYFKYNCVITSTRWLIGSLILWILTCSATLVFTLHK